MKENAAVQKAIEEIEGKHFAVTTQLLEIHEIVYDDAKPKVLKVNYKEDEAIVYFAIKDEEFYFVVYINTRPEIKVRWVDTAAFHSVYFRASSKQLDMDELAAITTLTLTLRKNKLDPKGSADKTFRHSYIKIEPNPEPDEFENKLEKLLLTLEQDKIGIGELIKNHNGYIQVYSVFHNGNTMLGGHHLDKATIKRLAALGCEIDFDVYAEGNFFKE